MCDASGLMKMSTAAKPPFDVADGCVQIDRPVFTSHNRSSPSFSRTLLPVTAHTSPCDVRATESDSIACAVTIGALDAAPVSRSQTYTVDRPENSPGVNSATSVCDEVAASAPAGAKAHDARDAVRHPRQRGQRLALPIPHADPLSAPARPRGKHRPGLNDTLCTVAESPAARIDAVSAGAPS